MVCWFLEVLIGIVSFSFINGKIDICNHKSVYKSTFFQELNLWWKIICYKASQICDLDF
jgi:hypothetical protein